MNRRLTFIIYLILVVSMLQAQDTVLVSSDLPIIVINTDNAYIVDEPKTGADMGIIYNGSGQRNFMTDAFNHYDGRIGIELRGQSSQWLSEKKSYGLETREANGDNLNIEIFGMPSENDWILYGPATDKTMVRNTLMYQLSNEVEMYASRTQFVELVLNGSYQGVYVWMEKIKRDKNRLDIEKIEPEDINGAELTGGYILRLDKFDPALDGNLFDSKYSNEEVRMQYQVVYPKPRDIAEEQFEYIQDYMNEFEDNLRSKDFNHPVLGVHNYIDYASFVDFLLLNELARNPDAYRISTYFYKKNDINGGKLHMGPIWDFNIAMGNANFCLGSSHEGWVLNYNFVCPEDFWLIGYWWDFLLSEERFLQQVKDRWFELRETTFSLGNIHSIIDEHAALLGEAEPRNHAKWDFVGNWVWPNDFVGNTYEEDVEFLKDWFGRRVSWMDRNMEEISRQVLGENSFARFKLYPNPFSDYLKFDILLQDYSDVSFQLYNSSGQLVYQQDFTDLEQSTNYQIDLPATTAQKMSGGIYFYQFVHDGLVQSSGKLIKQ